MEPASLAGEKNLDHSSRQTPVVPSKADDLSQAFRAAARSVLPAVVQIRGRLRTDSISRSAWSNDSDESNSQERTPPWFAPDMGRQTSGPSPEPALGSGIIVDASGIVLTNNHLLENVEELYVQTADDQRFPVIAVIAAPDSDLAVLKVKTQSSLPAATLGNSDRLQIGDWVLTIGSPLDLRQTVCAGIISATNRKVDGAGSVGLLQTDAAINPGSSGGALINLQGEVVGITTGIASEDGGYQGIGFAIPVKLAVGVISQLPENGSAP
jgi:serine protease Do